MGNVSSARGSLNLRLVGEALAVGTDDTAAALADADAVGLAGDDPSVLGWRVQESARVIPNHEASPARLVQARKPDGILHKVPCAGRFAKPQIRSLELASCAAEPPEAASFEGRVRVGRLEPTTAWRYRRRVNCRVWRARGPVA